MDEKKTILCVDDDPLFGDLYKAVLEPKGFVVEVALNPSDGYEASKRVKPSLIILDVMMPEKDGFKDGFDLLERLRKEGPCMKTPVIMISAIGSPEDMRHGIELGANFYLAKQNMVPESLWAAVKKHIG